MLLTEIDQQFTQHYRQLLDIQKDIYKQLCNYPFKLDDNEITESVINRMHAFWYFNVNNNKEILGRQANSVAADFFTETVLLFIKSYFAKYPEVQVYSERSIVKGKKSIKPDISIWKCEELIGVLELKVNDGWKRKAIGEHLQNREAKIKNIFPHCYFGVLAFWNFFDTASPDWNTKYIGLKNWNAKGGIATNGRIENLIRNIEAKLQ
ncbi:hypothetical protein [Chryseobacterium sp. MFBS3-17]|uniref:hypothetical protein n=1 Tax=Chryseobacterium sp. MFBS3-17 TaxID=2886689 RepID=UPI001D0E1B06|nr:hypothetical protein [Chryseobacterium sp. MFBS3-17]MCC2591620.1 hypothetical protein [Chryseobacterium sp. MFBS3-17]